MVFILPLLTKESKAELSWQSERDIDTKFIFLHFSNHFSLNIFFVESFKGTVAMMFFIFGADISC